MSLHPDLNNLRLLCTEILALDTSSRELDYKRAKATGAAKIMFEMARDEMNKELEITCRRLRHDLNNFYGKNEVAYFRPSDINDQSKT